MLEVVEQAAPVQREHIQPGLESPRNGGQIELLSRLFLGLLAVLVLAFRLHESNRAHGKRVMTMKNL